MLNVHTQIIEDYHSNTNTPVFAAVVDQLRSVAVKNYDDIEKRIAEGTKNRTIASTNMNATSSRAHTIVAVSFMQKTKNETGQDMTKTSVINLVDLAGRCVGTAHHHSTNHAITQRVSLSIHTYRPCIPLT